MPLIGHAKERQYLLKKQREDRIFPVMIFHGPNGIGKKAVALELICNEVCSHQSACGDCPACQKVQNLEYENLFVLRPEGKFIKIEAVRQLLSALSLRAQDLTRYVILEEAEKLNPQAANALLKTLEEPPEKTVFILLTSNLSSLLPTIRSRAIPIAFNTLSFQELQELSPESPTWLLKAAQGRPGLLEDLKQHDSLQERKLALEVLSLYRESSRHENFQKIKQWVKDKPNWDRVFFFMQSFLRDARILSINEDKLLNLDQKAYLQDLSQIGDDFIDLQYRATIRLQEQFLANQDKSLCLENFWFESKKKYVSVTA
tara:strand:- start:32645 stop:33592 length:948 start_codon:yes stop_codon:yes gene_type:complete